MSKLRLDFIPFSTRYYLMDHLAARVPSLRSGARTLTRRHADKDLMNNMYNAPHLLKIIILIERK